LGGSIATRAELGEAAPRRPPRPPWMRNRLRTGPNYLDLKGLGPCLELHTVCEEASCPNVYECWEAREATFLILGRLCTRRCGFCDIATGKPGPLDPEEPVRVAGGGGREGPALPRRARRRTGRRPAAGRRRHLGGDRPGHPG